MPNITGETWQAVAAVGTVLTGLALVVVAYMSVRLSRQHQRFLQERDEYLFSPKLSVVRRMTAPKVASTGLGVPKRKALVWKVGLQNTGEIPILAIRHWVQFQSPEATQEVVLLPDYYTMYEIRAGMETLAQFPLTITRDKGEVVLEVSVDHPGAEQSLSGILGEERTLGMTVTIGYQVAGRKQHDLAYETSGFFKFPEKPELGSMIVDVPHD